jgi:hypothetical protein
MGAAATIRLRLLLHRQSWCVLLIRPLSSTAHTRVPPGVSYGPELATASARATNVTFDLRGWRTACLVLRNAHGRDVLGSQLCVVADAMGVDKAVSSFAVQMAVFFSLTLRFITPGA